MGDEHRVKIANSNILKSLIKHVEGKQDMSSSQVTAGIALLKKVMPDLTENTHKGDKDAPLSFEAIQIAPLINDTND